LLYSVHTSNNVEATLSNATSRTILSTMLDWTKRVLYNHSPARHRDAAGGLMFALVLLQDKQT